MLTFLLSFLYSRLPRGDRGATAVEYGLLIAGIAALVAIALITFGPAVRDAFTSLIDDLS
jgi:pilus assembly protein Flp/PilA